MRKFVGKKHSGFWVRNISTRDLIVEVPQVQLDVASATLRRNRGASQPATLRFPAKSDIDLAARLELPPEEVTKIWEQSVRPGHKDLVRINKSTGDSARLGIVRPGDGLPTSPEVPKQAGAAPDSIGSASSKTEAAPKADPKPMRGPVKAGRIAGRAQSAMSVAKAPPRKAKLGERQISDEKASSSEDETLVKATSGLDLGSVTLDAATPSTRWSKEQLLEHARSRGLQVTDDMSKNAILRKLRGM